MTPTPITDALTLVVGGDTHCSSPGERPGGEWDPWFALSRRNRRRLTGAGWATAGGLQPDQLAHVIDAYRSFETQDEALTWFYRTALASINERRYAANVDRHLRVARAGGDATYYDRRDRLAREGGHGSLWRYRKAKGWT